MWLKATCQRISQQAQGVSQLVMSLCTHFHRDGSKQVIWEVPDSPCYLVQPGKVGKARYSHRGHSSEQRHKRKQLGRPGGPSPQPVTLSALGWVVPMGRIRRTQGEVTLGGQVESGCLGRKEFGTLWKYENLSDRHWLGSTQPCT